MLVGEVEWWCSLLVLAFSSHFLVHSQTVNKAQPRDRTTTELILAFPKGVDCTLKLGAKRKLSPLKLLYLIFGQRDANINAIINNISKIYHCSWLLITVQNMAVMLDSTPFPVTWPQSPSVAGCLLSSQEHSLLKTGWSLIGVQTRTSNLPRLN